MAVSEAFVFDAIRTPRGRGSATGALAEVKPVQLLNGLIHEIWRRYPGLDPALVEDLVLGVVTPVGDQGGDIAKAAALVAGLPETVSGMQLNRSCASGLEAVNVAAQKVRSGWESLVLAGGVEALSRTPIGSDGGPWANDPETNLDTGYIPQGIAADLVATLDGMTREDLDLYAEHSHARAAKAWSNGFFSRSVVPVMDRNGLTVLDADEYVKPETTATALSALTPAFAELGTAGFDAVALQRYHWVEAIDHVHTTGNSAGAVDGASLVLIGSQEAGRQAGLRPRARIVAAALSGADPTIMLTGPVPATQKALAQAGIGASDIDLVEINEAFAAVVLRFVDDMGFSMDQVNVNGGAIAMGHPLGATGGMMLGMLVDELERRDLRYGLATLSAGGGMGIATIVERV